MSDVVAIALITAGYSAAVGVVGWGLVVLLRARSLRVATLIVALVSVAVFVAGLIGTSRAMFISRHDLGVTTEVAIVAGLVAILFGVAVGETLARGSRQLQQQARAFGDSGTFDSGSISGPAELTALAQELERTSQRLRSAQERERRLESSRRELVAWVSHDLRTPLAGLRAMAEALEDGMVADPARYYTQMRTEVERTSRMVDDLFELSRIQSGTFELTPEQVTLRDLVSEAIAGAEPIAQARGVRLGGEVPDDVLVRVDPAGMARVLMNLLTNAIRHTPRDGSVDIHGRRVRESVELSVVDACGGIPADELTRVFDVAWRGSASRAAPDDAGTGAGLGLAIVKGIVEAHGGGIDVHNQAPGCRFLVTLPHLPDLPDPSDPALQPTAG